MPTLIELPTLEQTMQLCRELGLSFVELNMHINRDRKVQLFEMYQEEYRRSWEQFRDMCENAIGEAEIIISIFFLHIKRDCAIFIYTTVLEQRII